MQPEGGKLGADVAGVSDRPGPGAGRGPGSGAAGGIGSRLIAKLIEQRVDLQSRLDAVKQRTIDYERQLEQIDRELAEARDLLAEVLETNPE